MIKELNFNEFSIKALAFLTEKFLDRDVMMHYVTKLNAKLLTIEIKNSEGISALLYVNRMYEAYEEYAGYAASAFEIVMDEAVEQVEKPNPFAAMRAMIEDYAQAKQHFLLRLSNAEKNAEFLKTVPHKIIGGDLALTVHVDLGEHDGHDAMTAVTNDLLRCYGIDEDELFTEATQRAIENHPMMTRSLSGMFSDLTGLPEKPTWLPVTILTNRENYFGASALAYPHALEDLAILNGGKDFAVIPSSVHEVLVCPLDDMAKYQCMLRDVNGDAWVMSPDEVLSDHCYRYNVANHELEPVFLD